MSDLSMTIDSTTETALKATLIISDKINARSTAKMKVKTDSALSAGQVVYIYDGATKIFGGTIDSFRLTYYRGEAGVASRRVYALRCVDFNQITDRRIVAAAYTDETLTAIVTDLVTNYLSGESITVGSITSGSTVIKRAVFKRIPVSRAFDYLKDTLGLNWNIDFDKELTFTDRADDVGTGFTDATCLSMSLEETRYKYRNRQFVRGGDSTTEVQTDELPTPAPDGTSRVFTVRFPLAKVPTIKINTGAGDVTVPSADVGILGVETGKEWYWNKNSKNVVQEATDTVLAVGNSIKISYQGLKQIILQKDDTAEQTSRAAIEGGSGLYEQVTNIRSLDEQDAVLDYAEGLIGRYGTIPQYVTVASESIRSAGQLVNVVSANLGVSEDMLVTNVQITDIGNNILRYDITCASGEDVGTWVDFFRSLQEGESYDINGDEVVVILIGFNEKSKWSSEVTVDIFSALYPSDTLYPSNSQYPNGTGSQVVLND